MRKSWVLPCGGLCVKKAEVLIEDEVGSVKPPQGFSHTRRDVLVLPFSGYDPSSEVDKLLKAVMVSRRAVTVHDQTVTDVRDHKGSDDFRKDFW